LGPIFRPSSLPEHGLAPTPNLALFADAFHSRREAEQNVAFLRNYSRQHHDTITEVLKSMAVKPESREFMFQWIAAALQANHERTQEMFRYQYAHMHMSSDGFMFNLLSALLRMCAPFLDPSQPNFLKIDYTYLLSNKRMQASAIFPCCVIPSSSRPLSSQMNPSSWLLLKMFCAGLTSAMRIESTKPCKSSKNKKKKCRLQTPATIILSSLLLLVAYQNSFFLRYDAFTSAI
jgi:hypothetical protein